MREIKFRAWDKKKNIMWSSVGFRDTDCGRDLLPQLGMFNIEGEEKWTQGISMFDRFELMQYTGLKDKNGKEIYEGDIIKAWYYDGSGGDKEVVKYRKAAFESEYSPLREFNKIEVIGNIYENPELLK